MQKILIVDDEKTICEFISDFLKDCYKVNHTDDISIAYDLFLIDDFDLIITDYSMSKGSGIELIERVKKEDESFPIILMSGFLPSDLLSTLSKGFPRVYTLQKPFEFMKLKNIIDRCFD